MEKRIVVFKIGEEFYGVDIATINGIENIRDNVSKFGNILYANHSIRL